ncbi:Predicted DNA-binding transcriptional regulator YafY, contains an HTH and WYL domains [Micromonospora pattaloongensis]|uniref:Predicted DNA-binding transcriptional regulator YafY, contains an HTH and WYL domains n=1 Tax=Micromonospora pattaloongensis TaxID=405436 RepID=A0A1H3S4Z1_9ACTN|nr:YafY family protein [Micromonospora pattaloongensis]SDZ32561.1 Predicted DNA-binding transcriptional regulator YafY, contains an HTH and WYL domains [Micromonospora pattaloongensis]
MSHPASRVLGMLELLQAYPRLTGADLGQRLGVDERTVRRYAATLIELGLPVVATRGRRGGYRLGPGRKLPPLMLTDDEAFAVLLGLVAAEQLGLDADAPGTAPALAKIGRMVPAGLAERLAGARQSLGLTRERREGEARPAGTTLLTLGAATRARRRVSVTYRSPRGGVSLRELDPYGTVFHGGRWYVVGHDHRRDEIRTFEVDRISAVDVEDGSCDGGSFDGGSFTVPEGFDPVRHVTRARAGGTYAWEVEVLLETDLGQARRRVPTTMAELTESADGVLLRARVQDLDAMALLLAGLGCPFTILRPTELRAAVTAHASRLTALAAREPVPAGGRG